MNTVVEYVKVAMLGKMQSDLERKSAFWSYEIKKPAGLAEYLKNSKKA